MLLAAHQPNLMPHYPFFEKLHRADLFVMMTQCQFEKNGYQNRARIYDKWITKPVKKGLVPISKKMYTDGTTLMGVNELGIYFFCQLLGIDTFKIRSDFFTEKKGTERIIEICKHFEADEYLTNPDAMYKYLDERMMNDAGIKVIPFEPTCKKHLIELILEEGIEKTRRRLNASKIKKSNKKRSGTKSNDESPIKPFYENVPWMQDEAFF